MGNLAGPVHATGVGMSNKPYWDLLRLIGRVDGNDREMSLYFSRPITDDEMRALQDHISELVQSWDSDRHQQTAVLPGSAAQRGSKL